MIVINKHAHCFDNLSNIIFNATNEDIVFDMLDSKALITDYSGSAFDYLLLERPLLFLLHDFEHYKEKNREVYPGIVESLCKGYLRGWDELFIHFDHIFNDEMKINF